MLVSTSWLAAHRDDAGLTIVDLRWRPDGSGRERYERGHIPGAVFCDWATDMVDPDHRVAFMLAGPERFARLMERLGIEDDGAVIAYADAQGSGPFRLWLACSTYGHADQVAILDGGLDLWKAQGRPLEVGPPPSAGGGPAPVRASKPWTARTGEALLCDLAAVVSAREGDVAVLDSRPPEQFRGEFVWFETGEVPADADGIAHTPRGDVRAGRVPWARNVPWSALYRPDGRLLLPEDMRTLFAGAGVGPDTRVVTYCGVGISASALTYALRHAGIRDVTLYDGSWEEWGRDARLPVARGQPDPP